MRSREDRGDCGSSDRPADQSPRVRAPRVREPLWELPALVQQQRRGLQRLERPLVAVRRDVGQGAVQGVAHIQQPRGFHPQRRLEGRLGRLAGPGDLKGAHAQAPSPSGCGRRRASPRLGGGIEQGQPQGRLLTEQAQDLLDQGLVARGEPLRCPKSTAPVRSRLAMVRSDCKAQGQAGDSGVWSK